MRVNTINNSAFRGLYIAPEQCDKIYAGINQSQYKNGILDLIKNLKDSENSFIRVTKEGDVFLSSFGKGRHFNFYPDTYDNFIASLKMLYLRFDTNYGKDSF